MSDKHLRVATITLFMRALIAELDPKDRATKSATHICDKGRRFVQSTFKTQHDKDLLAEVANGAWDDAVTKSEKFDLVSVSTMVMELFDNQYQDDIVKLTGMNTKYVQSFFNNGRGLVSVNTRIKNKELSGLCIQAINKRIYDVIHNRSC